ncbi:MAG TPA: hypothetical protein VMT26_06285 [Candidatus Bathyarchaeia archaeon]|nr:hypothetical protein [Candidatus Bathyarchaeia archaeon]
MSQRRLTPSEAQVLQQSLDAVSKIVDIRLREGEYQYSLAKAIASFQLELNFPDVKDLIKRLYGEAMTEDIQFIRKIQTILKKMERRNIVSILPKKKPWDLQRYALLSFKFEDVDRNLVIFATDEQIAQAQYLLNSSLSQIESPKASPAFFRVKALTLVCMVITAYALSLWALSLKIIEIVVFIPAFSIAVVCSLVLGRFLSRR